MLNKAMQVMETLRNAEENRATLVNEHLDALNVLGYESTPIVINKGHIVEVQTINDELVEELQMQLDIAKEELAYYHDVEKDYNNDIKLFQEENAKLIDENIELEGQIAFKDGQILGLNNQIKELQAKIEELTNAKLDSIVKKHVEGDGAMEQPKTQPKKKNSPMYEKLMKVVKEEQQEENVIKETKEYAINFKQVVRNKKVNDFSTTMFEICGEITIDKTYKFKATNNYYYPIIYDCFDKEVYKQSRQIIADKVDRFNLYSERTTNDVDFSHAKDEKYPIVVWPVLDNNGNVNAFGAYTKAGRYSYVLTIDMAKLKSNNIYVGRKLVDHLFTDKDNQWRKLTNTELADKFIAICKERWPERFTNESEDTNEIVVDCTNDATAGCDDLDL